MFVSICMMSLNIKIWIIKFDASVEHDCTTVRSRSINADILKKNGGRMLVIIRMQYIVVLLKCRNSSESL